MDNQIYYHNSDKFPAIANDYREAKTRAEKITNQPQTTSQESVFTYALEAVPTFRRTASLPDKIQNGDYFAMTGALGLTLVNIKEDIRDMKSAGKQIYSKINKNYNYDPLYDRKNYQHSFSATRGLVGEELLHKKMAEGNPFAQNLHKMDKTLDETKFGKFIANVFDINIEDAIKIDKIANKNGRCAYAYKFGSSILGGKTMARAMQRTTLLGVVIMGLLELPKIFKETAKGDSIFEHAKNCTKQTLKSATNVVFTTVAIGIGGAVGAQYMGAAGSLIGMGIGAVASNKASKKVGEITG